METTTTPHTTPQEPMTPEKPQQEHEWLQKMVGEWTYEIEATMGPDQPAETMTGTETVRSVGGLWVIAEGHGEMCVDGGDMTSIMTLGYNSQTRRYTGTWIGSVMTYLWVYDGELDATERVLTLNSEGPAMSGDGMAQYKDVIEFKSDDHRVMTSHLLRDDGQWQQFMTAHYRRQ
ncbi:MAG: DUF1579 domain-containing protein [Elainellaceae cyanobacterium]